MDIEASGMVNPSVFEDLQAKIDEDTQIKEELRAILTVLEKQGQSITELFYYGLIRPHPQAVMQSTIVEAEKSISQQAETISRLASVASKYPYYKYNGIWTRDVQNTCFAILLCGWLGGLPNRGDQGQVGKLLTIEEVGQVLQVPVNLKDRDAFHLTIEEYLQSLISLIDELARLAVNSVTLGDYGRPLLISQFIKYVHSGFQILNLKNDSLRRRSDSIKYSVSVSAVEFLEIDD
ncbi:hypothetical protein MMC14_007463 [Varicellaria rhodocarpa]|nr:hypothetical protein [Varicellaria rhodocarpa]